MSFTIDQSFTVNYRYPVIFTRDVFNPENNQFRRVLEAAGKQQHRVLIVIDKGVADSNPQLITKIRTYFTANSDLMLLAGDVSIVPGGEAAKQSPELINRLYQLIADEAICRHSFVAVIGGGAVIDAVGFAAATAHRGVRLIRMPTTVLAQNDAAMGVKNAVNLGRKKNFIGSFTPPWAVISDYDFLQSLTSEHKRAGMAEAIKIALIKDGDFFAYLLQHQEALASFETKAVEHMINRCAELHCQHISASGDPFENGSARPLDFGHWLGHKLEEISTGDLTHGDAVAQGIAVDSHYSLQLGWISEQDFQDICHCLTTLGFRLNMPEMANVSPAIALDEFRQHLGGPLTITLLKGIGNGVEVHQIDSDKMQLSLDYMRSLPTNKSD